MNLPTAATTSPAELAEAAAALRLAVGRLARRTRQEATFGHSLTQLGILATLDQRGPTTLGDLASIEKVAPPTITKAVAILVGEGLIEKLADPDDRRVHRAALTRAGSRELREMRSRRNAWLAGRLAGLDPGEVRRLADVVPLLEALAADDATPG